MVLITITFILLLLLIAAIISATETAITAARPGKIEKIKSKEEKFKIRSKPLLKILKTKDKVISTLLIGNSIANTISTTIATGLFIELLGEDRGTIIASLVMSFIIIIFSEVIPKAIAVTQPENTAFKTYPILDLILKILYPVNIAISYIVDFICKIFRINIKHKDINDISPTDEAVGIIKHHMLEGEIYKEEYDMFDGLSNIRNMQISDIMVHRSNIRSININITKQELIKIVLNDNFSRIPVWEDNQDNIIGILYVKDLINNLFTDISNEKYESNIEIDKIDLKKLIIKPHFIPETTFVINQLHKFREGKFHLACVVNEYGELQGILTLEDILEEIVGQIYDEYDYKSDQLIDCNNGMFIIDGSMSIRDLNRELNWNLASEDATTIAGFIINHAQRIPNQGEIIEIDNLKLQITKKNKNKIQKIKAIILKNNISK